MVWSPNIGNQYPFAYSGFGPNVPTFDETDPIRLANFAALNTNNEGASANIIDFNDDPYGPYYPGDEFVDWIGISAYNYNFDAVTQQTLPPEPNAFTDPARSTSLFGVDALHNFYQRFVVSKGKPFMMAETGSSYVTNLAGSLVNDPLEIQNKRLWWQDILTTSASPQFALWKAATWFEEIKQEQSYGNVNLQIIRDYRITFSETVKSLFLTDIQQDRIVDADQIKYTCSGEAITG
jgi:hypothetical protein